MLKYPIYVQSVTNLSDARYCAGMGVEMIGFCFNPESENYIDPTTAVGIIGWISGIKIVAEFGNNNETEIRTLIAELNPDYICISSKEHFLDWGIPIIYKIDLANGLKTYPPSNSLVLVENSAGDLDAYYSNFLKKEITEHYRLILATGITKENIEELHNVYQPYGFALKGGQEIAPGLKNFDELAGILETIETE